MVALEINNMQNVWLCNMLKKEIYLKILQKIKNKLHLNNNIFGLAN